MSERFALTFDNQKDYPVEHDCQTDMVCIEDYDSIEKTAYQIWKGCPLAGEYILSDEQSTELIRVGKRIFQNGILMSNKPMSIMDEQVLIYSAVYLTQLFDEEADENQLWKYIFERLGYDSNKPGTPSFQVAYNRFRDILKNTITKNNRYFSNEGQKYYNTLRIHALSPAWSIEHLLNILYGFYDRNLEAQYIPRDSAFLALAENISSRWEDERDTADELRLRSDSLASSFKMLFRYRPFYMAAICDALTEKMDALLKGDRACIRIDNRWDHALLDWYNKKTSEDKQKMIEKRKRASRERVATKKEQIRPEYRNSGEEIYIYIPRIRLQEITSRPIIKLYQDGREIAQHSMSVFGDDLCLTTRELQLPLSYNTRINWNEPLHFAVRVLCGEKMVYDSEDTLYRNCILLHPDGGEIKSFQYGMEPVLLLTDQRRSVEIVDRQDNSYQLSHEGKLYYLAPSASLAEVEGKDLVVRKDRRSVQWSFQKPFLEDVYVENSKIMYRVFDSSPRLQLFLPENKKPQQFYIQFGTEKRSLAAFQCEGQRVSIMLPKAARILQSVSVVEFATGKTILHLPYIVLPEFRCQFDHPYYKDNGESGTVKIRIGGTTITSEFSLITGQKEIAVPLGNGTDCVIKVPKLEISFAMENVIGLPDLYWYENCDSGDLIRVTCPNGIDATVFLGSIVVPELRKGRVFEAGNIIRSSTLKNCDSQPLWLLLRTNGIVLERFLITHIVYQEQMTKTPVVIKNRVIDWIPEDCYIGPDNSEFLVKLENDREDPWTYRTKLKRQNLERRFPCRDGYYSYQIWQIGKKNLFQQQPNRKLFEGTVTIGDPNQFRFDRQELRLRTVCLWSDYAGKELTFPIRDGNAILNQLYYLGCEDTPETGESFPAYEAVLQFETNYGKRISFNYNENAEEYELINPVKIWIMDESRLLLETKSGDPILVNIKNAAKNSSVQLVNSLQGMSRQEQYRYVKDAGIFTYESVPVKERYFT